MKASTIIRTVFALSVLLFPMSCEGDEILLNIDEETGEIETTTQADPLLSWSAKTYEATLGAENSFPTLTNKYGVTVSYSSSDESTAAISSNGELTLVAAGTTTITASSAETDEYTASSSAYTLTVVKNTSGISWSADSCAVVIGEEVSFPTLSNPGQQGISYTSSNENVAKISSEGTITLVAAGTTTITATSEDNGVFEGISVFYTLEVSGGDSSVKNAALSWSASSFTATLASENEYPTFSNPNGLEVKYSSSNTSVANISEDGAITLSGEGTVIISATSEATDEYSAGSASFILKVIKCPVTVEWSKSSFTAILEETNSYPELTVSPEIVGKSITYTSSNTATATVDAEGNVILAGVGTSTISATFAGDDTYKAASASYTLVVTSEADEGAGSFSYASSGDPSSEDDISNTTFTRMITVTYSGSTASITGDHYGYVSTSGANVTVNNTGTENIIYKLTGSSTKGSFKLYSSKKQAILLDDLTLANPDGAAINNQSGKRTFVMVEGANNLSDGSSAAYSTSDDEDMKGVLFSEGQLVFSGSGSLTVTANNKQSKSAIVSDDYVRVMGNPTIKVTSGSSAGHGIRGKEYVQITSGELSVATSAAMKKGIGSDDYVLVEGGKTDINVSGGVAYDSDDSEYKGSAGIKADNYFAMTGGSVTIKNTGAGGKGVSAGSYDYDSEKHTLSDSYISGGTLDITTTGSESNDVSSKGIKIGYKEKSGNKYVYAGNLKISGGVIIVKVSKSEGLEAKGNLTFSGGETYVTSSADDAINCQGELNVNDGYIYAYSSQNDAMDSNGNMKLNGGYVFAVTTKGQPEVALDANTEGGYKLYINSGATVVAYGGLEHGYSSSQTINTASCTAGSWNALYDSKDYVVAFKAPSGVSSVAVTGPAFRSFYKGVSVSGETFCNGIWAKSGISGGTVTNLGTYSGGMGGMGGGPGRGWGR